MSSSKALTSNLELPNGSWAVRIPLSLADENSFSIESFEQLRLIPGVEVFTDANGTWLRGATLNEQISSVLRSISGAERYVVLPDQQLARWGQTIPQLTLPDGAWQSLAAWMSLSFPVAAFAPRVAANVPFRLVRSASPTEANLLRTTWAVWRNYALSAPQFRLNQLDFAASETEALIRGAPIPPLPGQRFVASSRIAMPAGWRSAPDLDPKSLCKLLDVAEGTIALLHEFVSFELIPNQAFVKASRSAVRMTELSLSEVKSESGTR